MSPGQTLAPNAAARDAGGVIYASVARPADTTCKVVVNDVRRFREALHNDKYEGSDRMRVISWGDANLFEFLGAATYSPPQ